MADPTTWQYANETEVEFLTLASSGAFEITDDGVTVNSLIFANQSGAAATGRDADENEADPLIISCVPDNGKFTAFINSQQGPILGKYKFNYIVYTR